MPDFISNGLSGWIVALIMILISGGVATGVIKHKNKTKQKKIIAGRDVAGRDIINYSNQGRSKLKKSIDDSHSDQNDIVAGRDVSGRDIIGGRK